MCREGQDDLLMFKLSIKRGKERWFKSLWTYRVVCWDLPTQPSAGSETEKISSVLQFSGWKCLLSISAVTFNCRVRIWHKQHESMDPACFVSTAQAGGGVTMWGIFSWHNLDLLGLNEHNLNTAVYQRRCCWPRTSLLDHSVPILWWLFQQENARSSNYLELVSWTWHWFHCTQVTWPQCNRAPHTMNALPSTFSVSCSFFVFCAKGAAFEVNWSIWHRHYCRFFKKKKKRHGWCDDLRTIKREKTAFGYADQRCPSEECFKWLE